ncbi:histidine phosphatase family protein [Microseira sp. BLCC-F43]|jgi:probable phosphoglycerate mutase|uniref:histidine phosphatase family protein n=1 Tax=Microseira sp. BLCC-F43 TaxID=3153602 RepID=UPI0035B86DFE
MRLYFIRHGESEANRLQVISNRGDRYSLTAKGQQQARTLAENLKPFPLSTIFTSPLRRAIETAEILSDELGEPYQITDALREYDCGILEGKSDQESWRLHREIAQDWVVQQNWQRKLDGGESFLEIKNRFVPFIERLTEAEFRSDNHILLVGHGGIFQLMLPLLLTNIDRHFVTEHGICHTDCIITEPQPDGFRCLQWGEIRLV